MNDHRPTPWYLYLAFLVVPFLGSIWLFHLNPMDSSIWLGILFSLAFGAGLALASRRCEPIGKRTVAGALLGLGILVIGMPILFLIIVFTHPIGPCL